MIDHVTLEPNEKDLLDRISGPLWYRGWNKRRPEEEVKVCEEVRKALEKIGAMTIIVGHSRQSVRFFILLNVTPVNPYVGHYITVWGGARSDRYQYVTLFT
jgi:hypothetical protein